MGGKTRRKKGARRYKVKRRPGYYVVRDRLGRFKRWVKIPRSISVDATRKAKHQPKRPGYGHKGDYPARKGKGRFECPICGKRFRTKRGLSIHMARVHG